MPVLPISALLRAETPSVVAESNSQDSASEGSLIAESSREPEVVLPDGWEIFVHLNGGIYYTYDHNRLLTTDNICDPPTLAKVVQKYDACFRPVVSRHPPIDDLEMSCFHVDDVPCIELASWSRCRIYTWTDNKLSVDRSASFWKHALQFPMHRRSLPIFMETEFLSALAFGSNERVLEVKATTFPYEDAQIERLIRVYRDLRGPADSVPSLGFHIARTMVDIEAARKLYGYGTINARIYRNIAIPTPTRAVLACDVFLGIILCGTP
ncbi:hypothetical protein C8F04DRAFT_66855 [Mycena alexandri]|uniref:WW domain-containing protein n=1 Tax=Mycena alexandri TaxID=1745969 RepID=A0AAD6SIQ8_9AGAR|nr:hypothetical protein C8F04DRAFT_66855 [Mycena alexandri]